MTNISVPDQIVNLLRRGVMGAGELQSRVTGSPATVRRALDDLGPRRILRIGQGRATRYGARRTPAHCGGTTWPLYEVTEQGTVYPFANLHALEADQWYVEPLAGISSSPMRVGSDQGVFHGLPWFMDVARPQGFIGRLFVSHAHRLMNLPKDLTLWTDDHVLASSLVLGDDLLGSLLVGQAADRFSGEDAPTVDESDYTSALASSVHAVLHGESVGSSAAGEQPKFTLTVQKADGEQSHRMIKFSPEMVTPGAQRWGDLLIAEHVANGILLAAGISACHTRIRILDNRVYLESERFDRVGARGRRGLSAFGPPAYTLGYAGNQWPGAAEVLANAGLLPKDQVAQVRLLHAFGQGIGNSDMHLGNLSLLGSISGGWSLAPVYDMNPMVYAPGRTMEVVEGVHELPVAHLPSEVVPLVRCFWEALAQDGQVSADFQAIARHHASTFNVLPSSPSLHARRRKSP